jgi:hypothetical protein
MNNSTSDVEHKEEDDASFLKSFRNFAQSVSFFLKEKYSY